MGGVKILMGLGAGSEIYGKTGRPLFPDSLWESVKVPGILVINRIMTKMGEYGKNDFLPYSQGD